MQPEIEQINDEVYHSFAPCSTSNPFRRFQMASRDPALAGLLQKETHVHEPTGGGDVYTMAEAARLGLL